MLISQNKKAKTGGSTVKFYHLNGNTDRMCDQEPWFSTPAKAKGRDHMALKPERFPLRPFKKVG